MRFRRSMTSDYPPKPFPGSYWLKAHELLAGELPTSTIATVATAKLTSLLESGVQVCLNLLEISEFEQRPFAAGSYPNYSHEIKQLAATRGSAITCLRFPIRDMGVPTVSEMVRILDAIDAGLAKEQPVYFHCYAGLGRTGTVAGCWLVRHNLGGEDVLLTLDKIRQAQGTAAFGSSPQTETQCNFVLNWKQGQ